MTKNRKLQRVAVLAASVAVVYWLFFRKKLPVGVVTVEPLIPAN